MLLSWQQSNNGASDGIGAPVKQNERERGLYSISTPHDVKHVVPLSYAILSHLHVEVYAKAHFATQEAGGTLSG